MSMKKPINTQCRACDVNGIPCINYPCIQVQLQYLLPRTITSNKVFSEKQEKGFGRTQKVLKLDPRKSCPGCLYLKCAVVNIGNTGIHVFSSWAILIVRDRIRKGVVITYLSRYTGPSWEPASWFHLMGMQVWMIRDQTLSLPPDHVVPVM